MLACGGGGSEKSWVLGWVQIPIAAANVERSAAEQGQAVKLPEMPTLADVERVAEVLGVNVSALFLPT